MLKHTNPISHVKPLNSVLPIKELSYAEMKTKRQMVMLMGSEEMQEREDKQEDALVSEVEAGEEIEILGASYFRECQSKHHQDRGPRLKGNQTLFSLLVALHRVS